ncbi:unnamed protein product [Blepharisma stoltei]|uniref:Uncharacterized protein n=1 Tax=Blepharisma stoltei TaxID=1481888 RepID=A0AAU9JSU0_9CILI|nr:unnamed protein product [Blepharisma stoltei]
MWQRLSIFIIWLELSIQSVASHDDEITKFFLSEIEDYVKSNTFEGIPKLSASGCNPPISNCVSCITPSKCASCSASYLPNADNTQWLILWNLQ